jgi:hypothetical protein
LGSDVNNINWPCRCAYLHSKRTYLLIRRIDLLQGKRLRILNKTIL